MKTKIAAFLILTSIFAAPTTAAIDDLDAVNMYPDSENRFRDTTVIARLASDATTDTEVNLWLTRPDGTVVQAASENITVKNNQIREIPLRIADEKITQYGEYTFKLNETTSGQNSTFVNEVIPQPDTEIKLNKHATIPFNEFVTINVNPFAGPSINFNEIKNATVQVYRIDDDPATLKVEKTLVLKRKLAESQSTRDLEQNFDTSNLSAGQYEINVDFNITSCGNCEKYGETESTVLRLENSAMTNVAAVLGLAVLPFLVIALIREFKSAEDMETGAVLLLSVLFVIGLEYTAYGITQAANLSNASQAYLVALLVTVLVFIYLTVELIKGYWRETRDNSEFGYFDQ